MRILHFIPERDNNNAVRKEYFRHLITMSESVDMRIITTDRNNNFEKAEKLNRLFPVFGKRLNKIFDDFHPDVLHIHGCTGRYENIAFGIAQRHRTPVVVSPSGDLAAITLTESSAVKRLTSNASRARRLLWNADAIHVSGELEYDTVRKMQVIPGKSINKGISDRIFIIKNSVLTNSITAEMMCSALTNLYKKVIYRRPYDVMLPVTRQCEKILMRFGTCSRYAVISDEENTALKELGNEELYKIFLHAEQQDVRKIIDDGCRVLGIPFSPDSQTCREQAGIGNDVNDANRSLFADRDKIKSKNKGYLREFENYESETDLYCMVYMLHGLLNKKRLTYRHLAELCGIIIETSYDEDVTEKIFRDSKLYDFATRMMHILHEYAGLPEGFMPIKPVNDNKTEDISTFLTSKSR